MRLRKFLPSSPLQPFVKCCWILDVDANDIPFSQSLFPFGSFELIFNLVNAPEMQIEGDECAYVQPDSLYAGQFTKPFLLKYTQPFRSVGVSLHPWAGNLLFDIPAQHFTNVLTGINDIDARLKWRERLINAKDEDELIAELEHCLLGRIRNYETDNASIAIAKAVMSKPTVQGYRDAISTIGCSRRRIEQRFLQAVGLPMGYFARKIRFQHAVNTLQLNEHLSLTQFGLAAGYYDQAHFTREFKEFSGITPKGFLKQKAQQKIDISGLMMA